MTREEIQAVFDAFFEFPGEDRGHVTSVSCRLFAERIAEMEREACAQVAEGFEANRDWVPGSLWGNIRTEVAAAIRARGKA